MILVSFGIQQQLITEVKIEQNTSYSEAPNVDKHKTFTNVGCFFLHAFFKSI